MSWWQGLVDDASIFPPGDAPLVDALAAYVARDAVHVGSFVCRDTDLPSLRGLDGPVSVVVTGGAGQLAGAAVMAGRLGLEVAGLEIALRDPEDLAGNARRVVAAYDALDEEVTTYVELPQLEPTAGWLSAADVVAERGLRLKFRAGGVEPGQVPSAETLGAWIDAALDRETPFKGTAGLHHAVAAGGAHGFLNVSLATLDLLAGAGLAVATARLRESKGSVVAAAATQADLVRARRWFTSFGSCDVTQPWTDLVELGLTDG